MDETDVRRVETAGEMMVCVFDTESVPGGPQLPAGGGVDRHRGAGDRRLQEGL